MRKQVKITKELYNAICHAYSESVGNVLVGLLDYLLDGVDPDCDSDDSVCKNPYEEAMVLLAAMIAREDQTDECEG